jgi:hypothetical protein
LEKLGLLSNVFVEMIFAAFAPPREKARPPTMMGHIGNTYLSIKWFFRFFNLRQFVNI